MKTNHVNIKKAEVADGAVSLECPSCASKITIDHEKNIHAEAKGANSDSQNKSGSVGDETTPTEEDDTEDDGELGTGSDENEPDWMEALFS